MSILECPKHIFVEYTNMSFLVVVLILWSTNIINNISELIDFIICQFPTSIPHCIVKQLLIELQKKAKHNVNNRDSVVITELLKIVSRSAEGADLESFINFKIIGSNQSSNTKITRKIENNV